MARTRTLAQLRDEVRIRADVESLADRHPDDELTRFINQSCQALREIVSLAGHEYYRKTSSVNTTAGQGYVAYPSDAVSVLGVDCTVQGRTYNLTPYMRHERNRFDDVTVDGGYPQQFRVSQNTGTTPVLEIIPEPQGVYPLVIYYVPILTALSLDADTFDGVAGWEEWVVLDSAVKVLTKEGAGPEIGVLMAERDRVEERIRNMAPKLQRAGAPRRVDTRGMRRGTWSSLRTRGWYPWR